jgi:hypothetical protein
MTKADRARMTRIKNRGIRVIWFKNLDDYAFGENSMKELFYFSFTDLMARIEV